MQIYWTRGSCICGLFILFCFKEKLLKAQGTVIKSRRNTGLVIFFFLLKVFFNIRYFQSLWRKSDVLLIFPHVHVDTQKWSRKILANPLWILFVCSCCICLCIFYCSIIVIFLVRSFVVNELQYQEIYEREFFVPKNDLRN